MFTQAYPINRNFPVYEFAMVRFTLAPSEKKSTAKLAKCCSHYLRNCDWRTKPGNRIAPTSFVEIFEALPKNNDFLKQNCRGNGHVFLPKVTTREDILIGRGHLGLSLEAHTKMPDGRRTLYFRCINFVSGSNVYSIAIWLRSSKSG